jgi:hypothetical protein
MLTSTFAMACRKTEEAFKSGYTHDRHGITSLIIVVLF